MAAGDLMEVIRDESGQFVERELVYSPTTWQRQGLHETSTGYGNRLNTGYKIRYAGKMRRVYAICHSNVASFYVLVKKERRMLGL